MRVKAKRVLKMHPTRPQPKNNPWFHGAEKGPPGPFFGFMFCCCADQSAPILYLQMAVFNCQLRQTSAETIRHACVTCVFALSRRQQIELKQ